MKHKKTAGRAMPGFTHDILCLEADVLKLTCIHVNKPMWVCHAKLGGQPWLDLGKMPIQNLAPFHHFPPLTLLLLPSLTPSSLLLSPLPLDLFPVPGSPPQTQLGIFGECCQLLQGVWTKPGRQMISAAFWGESQALRDSTIAEIVS